MKGGVAKMNPSNRMTVEDVSKLIGINVNTLQRKSWRKKMGIPLLRMGRYLISFRPILEKWIEEKCRKS